MSHPTLEVRSPHAELPTLPYAHEVPAPFVLIIVSLTPTSLSHFLWATIGSRYAGYSAEAHGPIAELYPILTITWHLEQASVSANMCALSIYRTPMHSELGWYSAAVVICVVSMAAWYTPGGSKVAEWVWNGVEVYCEVLSVLAESVATVLAFRGTGSHTIPGAYLPAVHTIGGDEHHTATPILSQQLQTNIKLNSEATNTSRPRNQASATYARSLNQPEQANRSSVLPKTNEVKPPRNPTPSPASSPSSTNNNERVRKYSKMRTLRLPGKPTRPIRLPTENELAVRRANERAAIEACQRDKYCARELAGDGLFIHAPATRTRPEPGAIEYCHVVRQTRRETTVGPIKPSWGNRYAMEVPAITISGPQDTLIQETIHESCAKRAPPHPGRRSSTCGRIPLTTPYISDSSELSPFVSAGFSSSSIDYTEDESNEDRTPFKESKLGHIVKYKRKIQEQGTKRLNKIRTNMSDWLATIGAGNNKLVADDVAQKAGPVLRASPIITPLSTPPLSPAYSTCSSDASAPDTPIEEFYLPSPIPMSVWAAGRYGYHQQSGSCSHA
ncbi:hypothetical protein RHS01_03541 [Rhizoctonia solani]|uniref:Uncharacterized protein n=1 Tax=Rhizoctonia solani TaxID=456999 RepID=A0A8H7IEM5_9AGAM|nr:hypothetical protein RHS01_03541 [Rhizoctonia solani]